MKKEAASLSVGANGADGSGLDTVLHAVAWSLDEHGLGVVQEAVEECRSQGGIVVEDLRPVFVGTIGRHDGAALLVALADDLKQQIRAGLVDGQIAQFIEDEQRGLAVAVQGLFEPFGALCRGEGIDHLHGGSEAHAQPLQAGGIAERRGQMRLAKADVAEEDHVALLGEELQSEQVLYLQAVDRLRPVPLELLQGLDFRSGTI